MLSADLVLKARVKKPTAATERDKYKQLYQEEQQKAIAVKTQMDLKDKNYEERINEFKNQIKELKEQFEKERREWKHETDELKRIWHTKQEKFDQYLQNSATRLYEDTIGSSRAHIDTLKESRDQAVAMLAVSLDTNSKTMNKVMQKCSLLLPPKMPRLLSPDELKHEYKKKHKRDITEDQVPLLIKEARQEYIKEAKNVIVEELGSKLVKNGKISLADTTQKLMDIRAAITECEEEIIKSKKDVLKPELTLEQKADVQNKIKIAEEKLEQLKLEKDVIELGLSKTR